MDHHRQLAPSEDTLLIQPRPGEKGWKRYDDYLTSEEKYKDFILEIEYKYPKGGNSGVYRIADPKDPVNTGIECQVLDSFDDQTRRWGTMTTAGSFVRLADQEHVEEARGMEQDDRDLQRIPP